MLHIQLTPWPHSISFPSSSRVKNKEKNRQAGIKLRKATSPCRHKLLFHPLLLVRRLMISGGGNPIRGGAGEPEAADESVRQDEVGEVNWGQGRSLMSFLSWKLLTWHHTLVKVFCVPECASMLVRTPAKLVSIMEACHMWGGQKSRRKGGTPTP